MNIILKVLMSEYVISEKICGIALAQYVNFEKQFLYTCLIELYNYVVLLKLILFGHLTKFFQIEILRQFLTSYIL